MRTSQVVAIGAAIMIIPPIVLGLVVSRIAGANAGAVAGIIFFAVILYIGMRYARKVTGKGKNRNDGS